uniref:ABC-2 type transporter transmembrane domain-containing protein n=1 Tax=Strombidium rassoulzadegani TaxID=1082188 RepID=A0A7S3CMS2_9SPIT|mmetsp:Transcript_17652/g.29826  ORF Transcript_17652/g.29826 Transcript_17652/m.29826 type:complete len:209 (+) Transcript_17652:1696-2322(+)
MSASFNVVFQVPLQVPVLKRELASKMYTPSSYYIGRFISNLLIQIFYPLIMVTVIYLGLGLDLDVQTYCLLLSIAIMGNWVFCGQGYFLGTVLTESSAKAFNMTLFLFLFPTTGIMTNIKDSGLIMKIISYVSPLRYVNEAFYTVFLRSLGEDKVYPNCPNLNMSQAKILDQMGYDLGIGYCFLAMAGFLAIWMTASLVGINTKFRSL